MYYTYVLQSLKDKNLYIGFTSDLKRRLQQHKFGGSISTKRRLPFRCIFYEAFINRIDAKNREEYLKNGWGWRSVKKILNNYFN